MNQSKIRQVQKLQLAFEQRAKESNVLIDYLNYQYQFLEFEENKIYKKIAETEHAYKKYHESLFELYLNSSHREFLKFVEKYDL